MLALILPLPEISRFTMPPPFKNALNHTWALLHGTTIETAQDQTGKLVISQKSQQM